MLLIFVVFCQKLSRVVCRAFNVSISIKAIKGKENMTLNTDSLASRINMVWAVHHVFCVLWIIVCQENEIKRQEKDKAFWGSDQVRTNNQNIVSISKYKSPTAFLL